MQLVIQHYNIPEIAYRKIGISRTNSYISDKVFTVCQNQKANFYGGWSKPSRNDFHFSPT